MTAILAYGSPSLGHLYPLSALLAELVARGHQVHLRTMASEVKAMGDAGFCTEAVDPRIEDIQGQDWLARNSLQALKVSLDVLCHRAVFEPGDFQRAVNEVKPTAVIVDANCWGAMAAAEASGVSWLVFSPFTPYLKSWGIPPFGPGLRPLPGAIGAVRDALVRPVVRYLFDRPVLPHVNGIRAELGIPPIRSVDHLMRRAAMLLAVGGEPFEYPHPDWKDFAYLIGSCIFEPSSTTPPEWLAAVDQPIVLVTTSSIKQADATLVANALQALADEPVHVVATCPAGVPAGLPQTANSTICRFVPHGVLLDHAVCAITHGGMGTTLRALERGVPVCVVPFGRDQAEVARRVQMARCGVRLPASRLSPAGLRTAVRKAMTMGEGARRVAKGLAATGGVGRGADLIEQNLLAAVNDSAEC